MGDNLKIVFTNGCFDIIHRGHLEMLKYSKNLGDLLIVAIDTDDRVRDSKGHGRPINNQEDRKYMLQSLRYVDKVEFFDTDIELENIVKLYAPDVMVVGDDYKNKKVIGSEYANKLEFFRRIDGYSTTSCIKKSTSIR